MLPNFWQGLERGARVGLITGIVVILAMTLSAVAWLLRADYQVLFADLSPQDANAMVVELDRMKLPYKLGDGGTSILVDKEAVHKTRIKLMGKDLPLHGTVGFELFNNADFGMTEFAQKVNYQRALQGEISRTILSLAEIEAVRVHLAMPEEGIFKRTGSKGKASITLTIKRGQTLRGEQIAGIQRLVSAAVPTIAAQDVTIVDQHGVALTRASGESEADAVSLRLELKKETENYLARKIDSILEHAFGPGQATASVDVTLNMDQVRVTTEDVIGAPARGSQAPAGIVVRERETMRDSAAHADGRSLDTGLRGNSSSQREVEYQVGRRVEQMVSQAGSVRRIHVVAVVKKALNSVELEQARELLAAAVGASRERGDSIVVQILGGDTMTSSSPMQSPPISVDAPHSDSLSGIEGASAARPQEGSLSAVLIFLAVLLIGAVASGAVVLLRRPEQNATLSDTERRAALAQIKEWIEQGTQPGSTGARIKP